MKHLVALFALFTLPASAQTIETAASLAAAHPAAYAAYRRTLPSAFDEAAWAAKLDGTSEPLDLVRRDGKPYVIGFVCKPHDCSANALAFLAAADGSRAVIVVQAADFTGNVAEVYGTSSADERILLKERLALPR